MNYPTSELDGITPDQIKMLKSIGIKTTEKFLDAARTLRGRRQLTAKTGIPGKVLLRWANMAHHMCIKGIGGDRARLLEAVGIITVRKLRYSKPAQIAKAIRELNGKKKIVRTLPTEKAIDRWIDGASKIDHKITY